jgi:hypothetical protein
MMMLTEREFTIGIVMYVLGKVIGFGFGWLAFGKDGDNG